MRARQAAPRRSLRGLGSPFVRSYFGTDGVRGVVGEFITPELVERLGKDTTVVDTREELLAVT